MENVKTPTSDNYHDYLIASLKKDPELAAAFITATLEEEEPEAELLKSALTNVAEALGEQHMTPEQAKMHLKKLEEILSPPESEVIYNLVTWLSSLGLKLTVTVAEKSEDSNINISEPEVTV